MEKLFPLVLIVLDVLAACVYGWQGDVRHAVYWLSAGVLTVCVTFYFYGSLEGGVGRGSGEATAFSDIGFSKCRVVVVWSVFVLKNTRKPDICDVRMSYCRRKT